MQHVINLVLSIAIVLVCISIINGKDNDTVDDGSTVCISPVTWSANDDDRPCYTVYINEDGSGVVISDTLKCNIPAGDSADDYRTRCYPVD